LNNIIYKFNIADLESLKDWLPQNSVELNENKTFFMVLCKPSTECDVRDISASFNNKNLKRVNSVKVLGVIFDDKLDFLEQCNQVIRKCNASLSLLYPIRSILSVQSKITLVTSLILSKLQYCSIIWSNSNKKVIKEVDKMYRKLARFIFNIRKYDKVTKVINEELEWLDCNFNFQFEIIKLCYKVENNLCPYLFRNFLELDNPSIVKTRSKSYYKSNLKYRTPWGEATVKVIASNLWLNLPHEIQKSESFPIFKSRAYAHLLTRQIQNSKEPEIDQDYN
jgi:hypothetical protein